MTERQREAQALRAKGLTYREVGEHLGVVPSTAMKLCKEQPYAQYEAGWREANRDKRRAWSRTEKTSLEYRGTCQCCGGPMGTYCPRDGICQSCITTRKEANWRAVELMWEDGYSMAEIAATLGKTTNSLGTQIAEMRKAGRAVPHRYKMRNGRRIAA